MCDALTRVTRPGCEIGPLEASSLSRHTLTFISRNFLRRIGTQKTTREYQVRGEGSLPERATTAPVPDFM